MKRAIFFYFLVFFSLFFPSYGFGKVHFLSDSLQKEAISETVPAAFFPTDFKIENFSLVWESGAASGVKLKILKGSLEWVRVSKILVFPRARLKIEVSGWKEATLIGAGFSQSFFKKGNLLVLETPMVLLSGKKYGLKIQLKNKKGKTIVKKIFLRFRKKGKHFKTFLVDTSCSSFRIKKEKKGSFQGWAYVGCRLIHSKSAHGTKATLEMFLFWDGTEDAIEVDGGKVFPLQPGLFILRREFDPGVIHVQAKKSFFKIKYKIPPKIHYGFLGFGIGPYSFLYDSPQFQQNKVVPLFTIYGSLFLNEGVRLVTFNATPVNSLYFLDWGLYLWLEQIRTIDERFSVNLLLGAHVLYYPFNGKRYLTFSAPQGIEMTFRDFIFRRYYFNLGAFIYPSIEGRAYYNTWVRFGTMSLFVEFNWISWKEKIGQQSLFSRSIGVSVGVPVFHFF